MIMQNKRVLGGAMAAVLIAAIGGFTVARFIPSPEVPTAQKTEEKTKQPADSVVLTPEAIQNAGIVVETVDSGDFGAEIVAQATVTASPAGDAIITARAGGAVTRVFKRLGDPVRAGETLAIVESRDAAQIAADREAANAKALFAQRSLARERLLFEQKVSARVDYERAQAEAAAAAAEARRAQTAASAANVTADGRGVEVVSPISGQVTAQSTALGAFVQPETQLFRVADPSEIQIEAAVGPADAERIVVGDRAVVELPDGRTVRANVRSVTPTLSGETRAATAVLDVPPGLQPGLAVRVRLVPSRGATSMSVVVPEDALQTLEGRDVVFTRTPQGFRAVPVRVGQRSAGRVEILSGLQSEQTIATRGAFLLKAELGKNSGEGE